MQIVKRYRYLFLLLQIAGVIFLLPRIVKSVANSHPPEILAQNTITELGSYNTPGESRNLFVVGTTVYVADKAKGLRIIDVSDPTAPTEVGFYQTPGSAYGVFVENHIAYIADGDHGLRIIDVSSSTGPTELGFFDTAGNSRNLSGANQRIYVADGSQGLRIIDVSTPAAPSEIGFFDTPGFARSLFLSGSTVYVSDGSQGLRIIDVSSPTQPTELGFYNTPGYARDVFVTGNTAYVSDRDNSSLHILDISNKAKPTEIGIFNVSGLPVGITVENQIAYLSNFEQGLRVLDVSDPNQVRELTLYDTAGGAFETVLANNTIYLADDMNGLLILRYDNTVPVNTATPTQTSTSTHTTTPTPTFTNMPTFTATPTLTPLLPSPTATVTPTPTPTPLLPDLTVSSMEIELETGSSCDYGSTQLGVRVTVVNIGEVASGSFVVNVNGAQQTIESGLLPNESWTLWFAGHNNGSHNEAIVDATFQVTESDETNNVLQQILPIPTLPPTCTPSPTQTGTPISTVTLTPVSTSTPTSTPTSTDRPTNTPTPTIALQTATSTATHTLVPVSTSTPTPTPTDTSGPSGETARYVYLPLMVNPSITMTSVPTPIWQRVAGENIVFASIDFQGDSLFAAAARNTRPDNMPDNTKNGLYRGNISGCQVISFTQLNSIAQGPVFDTAFQGLIGWAATEQDGAVHYTVDGGASWTPTESDLGPRAYSVLFANNVVYAGSEDQGVFVSLDNGIHWETILGGPDLINILHSNGNSLWIGTSGEGVWELTLDTHQYLDRSANLAGHTVWDIVSRSTNDIFTATEDGVYRSNGQNNWETLMLPTSVNVFSLAISQNLLYAGTQGQGIWRMDLETPKIWRQENVGANYIVRDLSSVLPLCNDLWAATNNGIWVLR